MVLFLGIAVQFTSRSPQNPIEHLKFTSVLSTSFYSCVGHESQSVASFSAHSIYNYRFLLIDFFYIWEQTHIRFYQLHLKQFNFKWTSTENDIFEAMNWIYSQRVKHRRHSRNIHVSRKIVKSCAFRFPQHKNTPKRKYGDSTDYFYRW